MAQSSQCYLPGFASAVDGPKRPVSMKMKPTPSQNAQLLTAWHEGRLTSVLQASWALVLHYYLRTEDICFGYQHIDGDCSPTRNPVQNLNNDNAAVRLAINDDATVQAIVDTMWKRTGSQSQLNGNGDMEDVSNGYLPYNTILMLRTYRKASDTPSSPSKPFLAAALPDEVRSTSESG